MKWKKGLSDYKEKAEIAEKRLFDLRFCQVKHGTVERRDSIAVSNRPVVGRLRVICDSLLAVSHVALARIVRVSRSRAPAHVSARLRAILLESNWRVIWAMGESTSKP